MESKSDGNGIKRSNMNPTVPPSNTPKYIDNQPSLEDKTSLKMQSIVQAHIINLESKLHHSRLPFNLSGKNDHHKTHHHHLLMNPNEAATAAIRP